MLLLPKARDPLISVVMVTYGGWDWPYRSLDAMASSTEEPAEVICVDNASWDGTGDLMEELVAGATLIRNRRNRGFAAAANQGARAARGRFLCFLNPDCVVRPGWLPPLLAALARQEVGAAIPRFLGPDGAVQEAGSVVDRQGWTEAVGAGTDPRDPGTRFARLVDYGSAACLVIGRDTFRSAGGFDEAYHPAYCEDVDLAFRLRDVGLHTRYEPAATVEHAGTVSTGRLTRDRLIERNRRLLLRRWGHHLSDRPSLTDLAERPHRVLALRDALAPDRLLVLADRLPGASEPLGRLCAGVAALPTARVTVLAPAGSSAAPEEQLLGAGVEVTVTEDVERWLADRRYHYSAVVAGTATPAPLIHRWQPQAAHVSMEEATGASPEALALGIGATAVA